MSDDAAKKAKEVSRDFLRLMGECLVRWQTIEHQTYWIFQHLADCRSESVGSLIFFHTRSSEQKIALLDKLACHILKDTYLERWRALLPTLRTLNTFRDRIAHFQMVAVQAAGGQDYELWPVGQDVRNRGKPARSKRMSRKAVNAFSDQLRAFNEDLNQFRLALWAPLGKPTKY